MITIGSRRTTLVVFIVFFFLLLLGLRHDEVRQHIPSFTKRPPSPAERLRTLPEITRDEIAATHLLLPVTSAHTSLCKTLMTAAVLGYPVPTLIGWNKTYTRDHLVGGGRFVSKIEGVLEWLESQVPDKDDEIVVVVDAYGGFNYFDDVKGVESHIEGDAWFQLPVEVLLARYHAIVDRSNEDLAVRMGRAYEGEEIKQTILFGSSKRCTPNKAESAACYPIPGSPIPDNLYGKNTDSQPHLGPDPSAVESVPLHKRTPTPVPTPDLEPESEPEPSPVPEPVPEPVLEDEVETGPYDTFRQRFLASGTIIGPIGPMRLLFQRAHEKANAMQVADGPSLGSDQAIFHRIFGEQEFQREAMRRRFGEKDRKPTTIDGLVVDDVLDPSFPHDELEPKRTGKEDEFGIGIDYWSDISMQTTDNADDGRWLRYEQPMEEQLLARPRQPTSCTPRVSSALPAEVRNSTSLPRAAVSDASQFSPSRGWDEIPLYTNVCLDTIPAVISHTGGAKGRKRDWPEHWIQPHGRRLIEEILDRGEAGTEERGGAYTGVGGKYYGWADLCPAELDKELYDDY